MNAEQRPCPACGTEFTWTPAAPRQKYCSKRCKHRWHDQHRTTRRRRGGPAPDVARRPGADDDRLSPPVHPPVPAPGTRLTAAPACPHCRQPVALVAWLVPPAASITAPPPHLTATRRDGP
jgi:endogenous inhibitor of DNA gyrase (YacG/DUF329 family)